MYVLYIYICRVLHTWQFTAHETLRCAAFRAGRPVTMWPLEGMEAWGDSEVVVILRCFLLKPWPWVSDLPGLVMILILGS